MYTYLCTIYLPNYLVIYKVPRYIPMHPLATYKAYLIIIIYLEDI